MGGGTKLANGSWAITRHSDALLVVRGGYVVHEEYWGTTTNTTLHDIESGGKSVASILLAHAMHHPQLSNNLSLNTEVSHYYPQLKPLNPGAAATPLLVAHCVHMAAGANVTPWQAHSPETPSCFDWNEQFRRGPPGQPDFVAEHGLSLKPGSQFVYSFSNTGLMSGVIKKATNMSYADYGAATVFPKLGIREGSWRWLGDREGHTEGDGDSYHTAQNYARLAYLMLNGGEWDGEQLLDPVYVAGAVGGLKTPTEWSPCSLYSHFFWRKPLAGVPKDAFYAWGGGGQFAVIVPSLDLLVVTLYGGILSRWDPPADIAAFNGTVHFPQVTDVISKTRDSDGLCTGSRGWYGALFAIQKNTFEKVCLGFTKLLGVAARPCV
jgi:CubicO group peptidase (beta-lactamase class C family)